jgi:iron complex outermembrane receptor protein
MFKSSLLVILITQSSFLMAEEVKLEPVVVKSEKVLEENTIKVSGQQAVGPYTDGGSALIDIPGVTITRKGGHGNDPVVRGQKYNRLNVKLGERFIHGGCPSRMDPPTSYVATEFIDSIEVHKGVYTLTEGRGGPGGTIIFKQLRPKLNNKSFQGKVGFGYEDNGDTTDGFTQLAFGNKKTTGVIKYAQKAANDYEDGEGETIRSSFSQSNASATLYWDPTDTLNTEFKYSADKTRDALYTGLAMDAPIADNTSFDLKLTKKMDGFFKSLEFIAYQSDVIHKMDNKLRNPMTVMEVESTSKTTGLKIMGTSLRGSTIGKIGLDIQNLDQYAEKIHGGVINTYMWPDAKLYQTGVFAEFNTELKNFDTFRYGLRIDSISAKANKADEVANAMAGSAESAYEAVYDLDFEDKTETNISTLVRYTKEISKSKKAFIGLSSVARTADINERFIHKFGSTAGKKETGNPDLNPEQHLQLDLGFIKTDSHHSASISAFYNQVTDFITKDRARGQEDVELSDGRVIYRNVDAKLLGVEIAGGYKFQSGAYTDLSISYTYGQNTTDKRALYEIPPVEYQLTYGVDKEIWNTSVTLQGAGSQPRVDKDSSSGAGIDANDTTAWAILNLKGSYRFSNRLKLNAGIRNLANSEYANHLNMVDVITAEQVQVNEPGRSVWLNTTYTF